MRKFGIIGFIFGLILFSGFEGAAQGVRADDLFSVRFGGGGISSLKHRHDIYDTEYIAAGATLGDVLVRYRIGGGKWHEAWTPTMAEDGRRRTSEAISHPLQYLVSYDVSSRYGWGEDLAVSEWFRTEGDGFVWTLHFRNLTDEPLEIGDIALPLPLNSRRTWDRTEAETKSVIAHRFISGHGSFIYWMRPSSVGPFLVMVPLAKSPAFEAPGLFAPTKLEYAAGPQQGNGRGDMVFIHSVFSGAAARERGGNWRQPHTSVILTPMFSAGSEVTYGFKFRWAEGYEGVRDILYEEGLFDVHVVPGMTVPENLEAMIALRTKNTISSVTAEHPAETRIESLGTRSRESRTYRVKFLRRGENALTVNYGNGQRMLLEFFVTEPLETLIKKRAAFLAGKQLIRDPSKWYDGLVSDWDMKNKRLLTPDDTEEQAFEQMFGGFVRVQDALTSGDPMLCKAPYIAAKNAHFPAQDEVKALDYHLKNFIWGKMQLTDQETPLAYGIYGLPNWKVNRESKGTTKPGSWKEEISRAYDYPHYFMLYLDMYRIAKNYPEIKTELSKEEYLKRAYGTARAYFTLPYQRNPLEHNLWVNKPSAQTTGLYNELVLVDLIDELASNGKTVEADWLRGEWEKKVRFFVKGDPTIPYFWGCEFPFCSTGFESTHALARYAFEHASQHGSRLDLSREEIMSFLKTQIEANIATRGWLEPAFYLLGGTHSGSLTYMSQMGGWAVLDYALYFSPDPFRDLRLGYASYLSSWALMNTGTAQSNYGYWYPGPENDGATGSEFYTRAFGLNSYVGRQTRGAFFYGGEIDLGFEGALRTAATVVVDDPLFGLFAYGGVLTRTPKAIEVIPCDGLRERFHVIRANQRFHMLLDRDGYAPNKPIVFTDTLTQIQFDLESRGGRKHATRLRMSGLPGGIYQVALDGAPQPQITVKAGEEAVVELTVGEKSESRVAISLMKR